MDDDAESLVFASGSAATAAMCSWISLPKVEGGDSDGHGGGHVLAVNDVVSHVMRVGAYHQYGGTARYLSRAARSTGLEVTYLDFEHAGEAGIRKAIRHDTKVRHITGEIC